MLRKYVGAVVIALLIAAWLATLAYSFLYVRGASEQAESVGRMTGTFRQELEQPRPELLAARGFPEGCVLEVVKSTWGEGLKIKSYPPGTVGTPALAPERARRR